VALLLRLAPVYTAFREAVHEIGAERVRGMLFSHPAALRS